MEVFQEWPQGQAGPGVFTDPHYKATGPISKQVSSPNAGGQYLNRGSSIGGWLTFCQRNWSK